MALISGALAVAFAGSSGPRLSPAHGKAAAHTRNKATNLGSGGRRGSTNIDAFVSIMEKFRRDISEWSLSMYKDWATDLFVEIVGITPQRTGRARANWQAATGGIINQFSITPSPGFDDFTSILQIYPDPIAPALGIINSLSTKMEALRIFNNVEYISNLDQGSSNQAPEGIVEVSLTKISRRLGGYVDALDIAVGFEDLTLTERGKLGL